MTKSEYRKLLSSMMDDIADKNIKILPILKRVNISSGNFYRFIRYDDKRGDRALSEEKLQTLYEELKKENVQPTNSAWLRSLDDKELAREIKNRFSWNDPSISIRKIEKWLKETRVENDIPKTRYTMIIDAVNRNGSTSRITQEFESTDKDYSDDIRYIIAKYSVKNRFNSGKATIYREDDFTKPYDHFNIDV